MEGKINGSVYHKFITNYQKPIAITKRESKNSIKESSLTKKKESDSFHSKLIYVNKKSVNIVNLNQNDVSSDMKTITNNTERTYTPLQNTKIDKNGVKPINSFCNGLPGNHKVKRKSHQSVNNDSNKPNNRSIEKDNNNNMILKRDKIKNKEEYLQNSIQKFKKIQNNINTNGNLENNNNNNNNRMITNYTSNNEPKRKKNFSLNYENEVNLVSNLNTHLNKEKEKKKNDDNDNEIEYEYLYNSNKINERKKNFVRQNINNNRELSCLIQENYNFNYHRKFNNYTDFNKNNSMLGSGSIQNTTANNRTNNSIDCNCTENYRRDNQDLVKEDFYKTTKTYDEENKDEIHLKTSSNKSTKNKNMVLNSNIQKKKLKELQQKLDRCQKDLLNTQKINLELERKNEDLQKSIGIVKKKK